MRNFMTVAVIGTALLIAGCNSPTGETGVVVEQDAREDFVAQYIPTAQNRKVMPYPNDIWLSGSTDGTLNVPGTLATYGAAGANLPSVNQLDGFSTTAPITVPFNFPVDIASVMPYMPIDELGTPIFGAATNFWVLNVSTGVPLFPLIPGVTDPIAQYEIRVSSATDTAGAVLEIVPLVPLAPDTTYAFVITAGVQDVLGNSLAPDNMFRDIRDACFSGETLSNAGLEAIKTQAVCPVLQTAAGLFGLPSQAFMMAWTVSTMSIGDSLEYINETATSQASLIVPTGVNTNTASGGLLPGIADILVGTLDVPYFTDPSQPYTATWKGAGGTTLTRFNPVPVQVTTQTIPLMLTVPNAGSGQAKPAEGWPVVIYLHGITSDRSSGIALADSFASQGFAVISVDQPLHGVKDTSALAPLLYQGPDSPLGNNERHFGLDNFTNALPGYASAIPGPDGFIDDGAQVITTSLGAPLVIRDLGRQLSSDLIHLVRTIPDMEFDGDALTQDLDGSRVHFVGVSLGSLMGATFLGTNTEISTATLSSPAGNWSAIPNDPANSSFGALTAALITGATGLQPNTSGFIDFLRDWQTGMDPIDPLNYAAAAAANSPIHALEILNENTVPNSATENWARAAGLSSISATTVDVTGIRGIVRFTDGGHTSLLDPSSRVNDLVTGEVIQGPNPLVTLEMQTEAVVFALSSGTQLPINSPLAQAGGAQCNCVQ